MAALRQIAVRMACLCLIAGLAACQTTQKPSRTAAQMTMANMRLVPSPPGHSLIMMAYNIRLGIGGQKEPGKLYDMPWGKNLSAVVNEIRSVDPDIVGLQEVAGRDQALALGKALDMNVSYVSHETARRSGRWWGVAVLSKFPIRDAHGVEISYGRGNQRTVLVASLEIAGRTTTILSIHKDKDLHDGSSIANIMDIVAPISGPVALIGDFNFTPQKSKGRLETIETRFADTATAVRTKGALEALQWGTFVRSKRRIDYIFTDPRYFTVLDAGVTLPAIPASDHRAYFAKLRWK